MTSSDSSDWLSTKLPKLAQLDSLQRCLICKDFLSAPVMTSCNHTFCSLCIRQHLQRVSSCPLCKTEQFESNLKRVILLEELVSCYKDLRPHLYALLQEDESTKCQIPIYAKDALPKAQDNIEVVEISDDESTKNLDQAECPVCGKFMEAKRLQERHIDYCLKGEADPKEILTPRFSKSSKPINSDKKRGGISLFFLVEKKARPSPAPRPKQSEQVDHLRFYFNEFDKHHRHTKRLPKIDFSSLSVNKLKEKLAALKLLTMGSRTQLELRYNQFYLLYNSNIDLNRPISDLELRQKLNQWEKSHQSFSVAKSVLNVYGDELKYKALSDKDFPIKGWLARYKTEYSELIRAARASHLKKREATANIQSKSNSNPVDMAVDKNHNYDSETNGQDPKLSPSSLNASTHMSTQETKPTSPPTKFQSSIPSDRHSTPPRRSSPSNISDNRREPAESCALSSRQLSSSQEFAAKPDPRTLSYIGHNYASGAAAPSGEASMVDDEDMYNFSNSVLSSK